MPPLALVAALVLAPSQGLPSGKSKITVEVKGQPIEVFMYKPEGLASGPLVMVFHGTLRNASDYRDNAVRMANHLKVIVAAPLFDTERFPSRKYQFGGIMNERREAVPKEEWTYAMIPKIVKEIRSREGNPHLPYYLIGHSAGGQFLVRMAAFMQDGARRIVAGNAGSHLFPTRDLPFGYGFGNLPESLSNDDVMKRYLAQPLTIYLGTADNGPDEYFDESANAMKQGAGRYQRGKAAFAAGQKLAKEKGWRFNGRLVEAPGIGHDNQKMWEHDRFSDALFGSGLRP